MVDSEGMSSFMPTIKCSMCSHEIEISMMGEHVCSGPPATAAPEPEPAPASLKEDVPAPFERPRNNSTTSYAQSGSSRPTLLKPGRAPPPRVDTSGANNAFLRPDLMTPGSSPDSRSVSPRTPIESRRSPFGKPLQRIINGPPSPEILSSNLDTAFPPFPTAKKANKKPAPPRSNAPPAPSERRPEPRYAEADPKYAPMSPGIAGTGHLLQRMNSIAPGPFDINGTRTGAGPNIKRAQTAPIVNTQEEARKSHAPTDSMTSSVHSRSSTRSSAGGRPIFGGMGMSRERTAGYGGFGRPESNEKVDPEPLNTEKRASTFPLQAEGTLQSSNERRPSALGDISQVRRPSNSESAQDIGSGQRRPSAVALPASRDGPIPRVATPVSNLGDNMGAGNPYHTPNLSQSSNGSERSGVSQGSSQSSPPSDVGRGRRPSENSIRPQPQVDLSKSMPLKPSPLIREQFAKPMGAPLGVPAAPESPMDPSITEGRLAPMPPRPEVPRSETSGRPTLNRAATAPVNRRPTTSKGNCKGCGEAIKGKSVSSADGRLTGRYHKQCFVCKTCREPFATATFYVIDDAPYCEHHYHQLNNSLCRTCNRGIEGQYLETERRMKHHPHCLCCSDCRKILKDGYFEMNGRVYCERDAYRRAQQRSFLGPGTNRMEKRSTRLMNI